MATADLPLTLTYRRQLDVADVDQWCFAPGECVSADPAVAIGLALVTGFVTFAVAAALLHMDDAMPLLEEERERTRTERSAFEEFVRRVGTLDAKTPEATIGAVGVVPALQTEKPSADIESVKEAYRETVMSVSHYEQEYDEPLEANMTAELGAEVAAAISDGTALTPQLKTALVRSGRESITKREEFLRRLDREAASNEDARSELSDVESQLERVEEEAAGKQRFDRLVDAWNHLGDLDARCQAVLTDRQRFVNRNRRRTGDVPSIQEYLYSPLDVDYPVLASGTALIDRIDAARSDVEAALARRP